MLEYSNKAFLPFIRFLGLCVLTTAVLSFAAKHKVKLMVPVWKCKSNNKTPGCNFSTQQQTMAHTSNWKMCGPSRTISLFHEWLWIWLGDPEYEIPYSLWTLCCLLKAWQEWPDCQGEFPASVGSSLYVTVKSSLLFSVHNFLLSPHLNAPTYTVLLPACLPLPNWSDKAPQVQTDTNQEQVWLQISTMSSCRSLRRCPLLSWPLWHWGLNYSQLERAAQMKYQWLHFVKFSVWNKASLHPEVEAMSCPFYMLIRPCYVASGYPQSCEITGSSHHCFLRGFCRFLQGLSNLCSIDATSTSKM